MTNVDLQRHVESATGVLKRILFHALSLLAAVLLSYCLSKGTGFFHELIYWYLGVILLFPRPHGGYKHPLYLVPVISGLVMSVCAMVSGLIAPVSVFTGGIVCFTLKRLFYRKNHAWEWSGLVGIALGFVISGTTLAEDLVASKAWISFVVILVLGAAVLWCVIRLYERGLVRKKFDALRDRMRSFEEDPRIPSEVRHALTGFNRSISDYTGYTRAYETTKAPLDVMPHLYNALEMISDGVNGAHGTFKNELEYKIASDQLKALIMGQTLAVQQSLKSASDKDHAGDDPEKKDKYSDLDALSAELVRESELLDEPARASVDKIVLETSLVLRALRSGDDNENAVAFLSRYLKSAVSICVNYKNILLRPDHNEADFAAIMRARGVLCRMAEAFESERKAMDENGRENFEASLKAFEEFMKMNGH